MEFQVLGPLEVRDGGNSLALGAPKQRAVLALLLLHANEPVSVDRLIDDLWGEHPPRTAAKSLQVYVSGLRKFLPSETLLTRTSGYMLRVAEDEFDLARFERLQAQARQTEPARAAELLRDALALWRGPPLADFAYEPWALAEIARLAELRVAALEERVDADLALGRHGELVGELEALVARHPLRERARGQLMLALYRSGRQAEALASYQEGRRALVEDLGIEPGRDLQKLERSILRQDPALDVGRSDTSWTQPEAPAPQPEPEQLRLEPTHERKLATALFADLVGSTELGEQDPERTRVLLERYYDAMAAEVERSGGTVEKFAGDAVMATFGAPLAQEDHAERALHAALAMRERCAELFGGVRAVRIGVNTGEVVVGRARAGSSFVTGDSVNVAARLEQAAEPGEILVGERTASAARGAFAFGDALTAAAKGKPAGVPCRSLLHALALTRPRGLSFGHAFVGRESELELMRATYSRVERECEPHLVTVVADAGVGKTSLVGQFWEWLGGRSPEPLLRSGRCLPYGRGITYWPLGEVLKAQLGILESDPIEVVRRRLGERQLLGMTLGLEAPELHPLVARERLHETWLALLDELVADRPVVLLVEDIHWAEAPLFDLLDRLSREVQGPLLLLATARPEMIDRRPGWGAGRNAARIWLEPLSTGESSRLLERLLVADLPERLRSLVLEPAEGNPFFLEEILATLVDRRILERHDGHWRVTEPMAGFAIPDSVQSVLAARIDLLDSTEKAALQAASVVGRVFWAGPVAELLGAGKVDFRPLEERDFVRRRPDSSMAGERELAFKHALTREVAYASLPKARRARLHAGFADWLERFGEGRDEHAALLAHHYAEAIRPEDVDLAWGNHEGEVEQLRRKALAWLRRAADLAFGRYALAECGDLFRRAAQLATDEGEQAELLRRAGRASALSFDRQTFWETMLHAAECAEDPELRAECYGELAFESVVRFMHAEDRPLIEEWTDRALAVGSGRSRARAHALVARSFFHEEEAGEIAAEAAGIARRLGDLELLSWALYVRTDAALGTNDYAQAQHWAEQRRQLLSQIRDPDHVADAYWSMIPAYAGTGLFDQARQLATLQDAVTSELTPHHRVHGVAGVLEVEELAAGWQQIGGLAARVEQVVAANADRPCVHNPRSLLVCALANAYLGNDAEAARLEALADSLDVDEYGRCFETRARLSLLRGDLATVERLLAELDEASTKLVRVRKLAPRAALLESLAALGDGERIERLAAPLLRPGTYLEPFALRALGIAREDAGLIERAIANFEAMGLAWHAGQTRARVEP
jgi:DNA-binding SARP family transcriptional activator